MNLKEWMSINKDKHEKFLKDFPEKSCDGMLSKKQVVDGDYVWNKKLEMWVIKTIKVHDENGGDKWIVSPKYSEYRKNKNIKEKFERFARTEQPENLIERLKLLLPSVNGNTINE